MSRAVNLYARGLLGLRTKDCSGAFRCYRTEVLARLDFDAIRSRGYSFQEEILWRLKTAGGAVRRNAHRVRRAAARGLEDRRRRSGGGAADHFRAGGAKPAAALKKATYRVSLHCWTSQQWHPAIPSPAGRGLG